MRNVDLGSFKSLTINLLCEDDRHFHCKQNEGFYTLGIREVLLLLVENVRGNIEFPFYAHLKRVHFGTLEKTLTAEMDRSFFYLSWPQCYEAHTKGWYYSLRWSDG